MQKTSLELIKQATKLANCQNSEAFDFAFKVQLLNNVYTNIYNDLTGYSNYFIRYFTFEKESDLPPDCNKVMMVFRGSKDNPFILSQSSPNNFIPGDYIIENNTIRVIDKLAGEVTVKYSAIPLLLTAPEEPKEIELITPDEFLFQDDDYLYYLSTDTKYYKYSFEDKTNEEVLESDVPVFDHLFNNNYLTVTENDGIITQVLWNATDVTDYFSAYDNNTGASIRPVKMVWDNTHIAITYENNDVYVMTADWNKVQINPFLIKGRYFKAEAVSIFADDEKGTGLICKFNNKYWFMSFVPDTVLEYPENVFFEYIEDLFAVQLQGLVGINNDALQTKLTNDEQAFYSSLQRSQQGIRIKNESNYYKRIFF